MNNVSSRPPKLPSMSPLRIDRTLLPVVLLLLGVFLLFEKTTLDIAIQDRLFDFEQQAWLIGATDPVWRAWCYNGPKGAIIVFGVGLLALILGPPRWRAAFTFNSPPRKHLLVALLNLAIVPTLIGQLKTTTNVFCPNETRRYGGDVPYVRVLDCYPEGDRPARRGRCFPAGHASGGFALLALAGLARTRRGQLAFLGVASVVGGAMGFYQMAKGAHYLSHTVVTAGLAWTCFLLCRRALRVNVVQATAPLDSAG